MGVESGTLKKHAKTGTSFFFFFTLIRRLTPFMALPSLAPVRSFSTVKLRVIKTMKKKNSCLPYLCISRTMAQALPRRF